MRPFTLERPHDIATAVAFGAADDDQTDYIAGGTDMMQLLTDDIRRPGRLVSLGDGVLDDRIEAAPDGALRLGAAARMSDVADHPAVREGFPLIAEALLSSASAQVRNMATVGGNLLQRTRCAYFRDPGVHGCNKRAPGTGCAARDGVNRMLAVLGGSEHCIATHASDFAVPLVALDAVVRLSGPGGERTIPVEELHRLPGDSPHVETVLVPGELITAIEVPASRAARTSHYLKVRDRESFEFALVSAAVALDTDGGRIREARVAMGGVGPKPWRMRGVERALAGAACDPAVLRAAAARAADGTAPRPGNAFKPELMRRTVLRALRVVGGQP
ncbi:FAD binding domain-containing protein [Marinitenerispora sediminis]|uniref:FAD-binding molybdopterin dehydrogenase n=1 Tax=Marinitenerispora sediminis TaxID=1931232 RepID=A0A368T333_9ACTN|nr:xanthine dehydrogenase family protein subunit M [Marinitenerispora sediminis]RCV49413.1 FAD-binding molybdopterin dehydrogenase [Marinitenerispora sediminis]RCV52497.1 FAD-binding molybdopterin dehydrogenase [Marinitenerispora sediminis]RCV56642.1 FAD-binding molybdopterin dehydrogenase [Marinitenerispora sediminis]